MFKLNRLFGGENPLFKNKKNASRMGTIFLIVVAFLFAMMVQSYQRPLADVSYVMDTFVEYHLFGSSKKVTKAAKDEIDAALQEFESKMSMYREDSEISKLNAAAGNGEMVPLSDDVYKLLALSQTYMEQTDGRFNITIAPLSRLWDITAETPSVPAQADIERAVALVKESGFKLDEQAKTAALDPKGAGVDLGGIAKGYACDMVKEILKKHEITSGYVSIGGNMVVIGDKPDGAPFQFGVRNPREDGNKFIMVVNLKDLTMATSGDYERYFEQDGVRYHHILDPDTGYPAQSEWISVSVISPDGAYADFMSTYFFLAGKDFLMENYEAYDCGVIAIDRDRNVYITPQAAQQVISYEEDSFKFEVLP